MYEYKMIQLPLTFTLQQDTGKEIAVYLQKLSQEQSGQGWEFYRIDTVGVATAPGCGATMMGTKATMSSYNIVTFRKPKVESRPMST